MLEPKKGQLMMFSMLILYGKALLTRTLDSSKYRLVQAKFEIR